ncbi:hypothetical protein EJ06DRAFT_141681 [Trichodelitschia bisporula]|uniref:Uncharacterized protein n=1 Tax=Trichodelitschia bisporula TaxID=703511 RepID=A0A6G1HPB8_9PEZI|nr:hypothetical protein EJ06DRAFT_141681 [Trichodelitschia bisporula]
MQCCGAYVEQGSERTMPWQLSTSPASHRRIPISCISIIGGTANRLPRPSDPSSLAPLPINPSERPATPRHAPSSSRRITSRAQSIAPRPGISKPALRVSPALADNASLTSDGAGGVRHLRHASGPSIDGQPRRLWSRGGARARVYMTARHAAASAFAICRQEQPWMTRQHDFGKALCWRLPTFCNNLITLQGTAISIHHCYHHHFHQALIHTSTSPPTTTIYIGPPLPPDPDLPHFLA